jgi:hypothetical protein
VESRERFRPRPPGGVVSACQLRRLGEHHVVAPLTSENSAIVMIDHAVGFGNMFRSHDLSLHVNNTVGLAKTAGVLGIPLVLTNGADTGPYGPLFSELRAVTGGARVIVREGN